MLIAGINVAGMQKWCVERLEVVCWYTVRYSGSGCKIKDLIP